MRSPTLTLISSTNPSNGAWSLVLFRAFSAISLLAIAPFNTASADATALSERYPSLARDSIALNFNCACFSLAIASSSRALLSSGSRVQTTSPFLTAWPLSIVSKIVEVVLGLNITLFSASVRPLIVKK